MYVTMIQNAEPYRLKEIRTSFVKRSFPLYFLTNHLVLQFSLIVLD